MLVIFIFASKLSFNERISYPFIFVPTRLHNAENAKCGVIIFDCYSLKFSFSAKNATRKSSQRNSLSFVAKERCLPYDLPKKHNRDNNKCLFCAYVKSELLKLAGFVSIGRR